MSIGFAENLNISGNAKARVSDEDIVLYLFLSGGFLITAHKHRRRFASS
jgi:hypothetical protein